TENGGSRISMASNVEAKRQRCRSPHCERSISQSVASTRDQAPHVVDDPSETQEEEKSSGTREITVTMPGPVPPSPIMKEPNPPNDTQSAPSDADEERSDKGENEVSDDEDTPDERETEHKRGQHMVRNEKRAKRCTEIEKSKVDRLDQLPGPIPDAIGVIYQGNQTKRDNSFAGALSSSVYHSPRSNIVFAGDMAVAAATYELNNPQQTYAPLSGSYLIIEEFYGVSRAFVDTQRDRAMELVANNPSFHPHKLPPMAEENPHLLPTQPVPRDTSFCTAGKTSQKKGMGLSAPLAADTFNILEWARYIAIYHCPGNGKPIHGIAMNVHSMSSYNPCLETVFEMMIRNRIPPSWVDHAYVWGMTYVNQLRAAGSLNDTLLNVTEVDCQRRLAIHGVPPPIDQWDGWYYPTAHDLTRIHAFLKTEANKNVMSLNHSDWLWIGESPLEPYYLRRQVTVASDQFSSAAAGSSTGPGTMDHVPLSDHNRDGD
ncbi:hypothetical protein BDZ94DRAFT_1241248, partial [Collybia nuda]